MKAWWLLLLPASLVILAGIFLVGTLSPAPARGQTRDDRSAADHDQNVGRSQAIPQLIRSIQRDLAELGYKPGPIDGIMGARTERAIRQFQRDNQLPITDPSSDSLVALKHLAWTLQRYKESKIARVEATGRTDDQVLISLAAIGTVIGVIVVFGLVTRARNRQSDYRTEQKKPYQTARVDPVIDDDTIREHEKLYQAAKVHHVIDGDTVDVATSWRKIRLRLYAIDCPEQDQYWGDIARYGLIKLIGGRTISFEEHGEDKYGRTLATIYIRHDDEAEWMNVNARMVTKGHAWVLRDFYQNLPKERQDELDRLEKWAKTKRVGLWNSADPVAPWDWRFCSNTVADYMVKNPVMAMPSQTISFVRQAMLKNSFSFLPVLFLSGEKKGWFLISDKAVAAYLRSASTLDERKARLAEELQAAVASKKLELTVAKSVPADMPIRDLIQEFDQIPVLVLSRSSEELLGILTPSDLL